MSDLVVSPNFLNLPAELSDPASAATVILPAPYDRTSSWHKGADLGPQAVINASAGVELYDSATGLDASDGGVATLAMLTTSAGPEVLARLVQGRVGGLLDAGKLPVVLGGEHSVSIGAIRAAAERHDDLTVLQIDCHADTRESYYGSDHSHACVMARAREVAKPIHVGIRSLAREERERIDPERLLLAHEVLADESGAIERVVELLTPRTYLTIDMDAFDPSLVPATGTPEPPGLSWSFVTGLIGRVVAETQVVAFDVVETAPRIGQHATEIVAAKLVAQTIARVRASSAGGSIAETSRAGG